MTLEGSLAVNTQLPIVVARPPLNNTGTNTKTNVMTGLILLQSGLTMSIAR